MRSRILLLMVLLSFCGPTWGQTPGPVRTTIYNEVDKMLRDKEAFPKGSKQYQELSDFRQNLRGFFQGQGPAPKNKEEEKTKVEDSEVVLPKTEQPIEKRQNTEESAEDEGLKENLPQGGQQKPKIMNMTDYAATMKHHKTLTAELQDVKALGQQVKDMHSQLKQQIQNIKNHHQAIATGGEIPQDYEKLMQDYEKTKKDYQQLSSEYSTALDLYNQHKDEYMKKLN